MRDRVFSFSLQKNWNQTPEFGRLDYDDHGELVVELPAAGPGTAQPAPGTGESAAAFKAGKPERAAGPRRWRPASSVPLRPLAHRVDQPELAVPSVPPAATNAGQCPPESAAIHARRFEPDPFDVETIHERVRASFKQMLDRATTPSQHTNRGRMLLLLGDSGAGKTHLLRGFRQYVHEYGRGFVAYAQLHSSSDDYARYLLQHVIHSLARPYAGPSGERTGLHELASGLPRLVGGALQERVARLTDEDWDDADRLADYINRLVDDLLEQPDLAAFDPDLLRVLLYALYPQHSTTSRVYKYLLCENMNPHDRRKIGDVVPRTDKGDPAWMIAAAWNDAKHAPNSEIPDDDEAILAVVAAAAKARPCAGPGSSEAVRFEYPTERERRPSTRRGSIRGRSRAAHH